MSAFAQNVRRLRTEKGLTQEELAASLGVSAQAVSKWETTDTYPDGALLLPLAKRLGVSLDTLFGNDEASMKDISQGIIRLLGATPKEERLSVARDICWQIERGLVGQGAGERTTYDPHELNTRRHPSYFLSDHGFTLISNGKEPFFSLFPEPNDGFGHFWEEKEALIKIFSALSHEDTFEALIYLLEHRKDYVFEDAVLMEACGITQERLSSVMEELSYLEAVSRRILSIDGESHTLYYSAPSHKLIALFLVAKELPYHGSYCLRSHARTLPLLSSVTRPKKAERTESRKK